MPDYGSRYVYKPDLGIYWDTVTDRQVSQSVVQYEIRRIIKDSYDTVNSLCDDLRGGEISLQSWYDGMREQIKLQHGLSACIAHGGRENMTSVEWGRVGGLTNQQYKYLNNWATQLQNGTAPLDGRFNYRGRMYMDASWGTYWKQVEADAVVRGDTMKRNVLGQAEHCPQCVEMSDLGWIPIDDSRWIPIGGRSCGGNCRCTEETQ